MADRKGKGDYMGAGAQQGREGAGRAGERILHGNTHGLCAIISLVMYLHHIQIVLRIFYSMVFCNGVPG